EGEKDLNLYYYNDITAEYEDMGTARYNNGNVTLSLDHCSTYALTEEELSVSEDPSNPEEEVTTNTDSENEKDETPKTGVNNIYVIVASILVVISASAIALIRKM